MSKGKDQLGFSDDELEELVSIDRAHTPSCWQEEYGGAFPDTGRPTRFDIRSDGRVHHGIIDEENF
jgi:hypothetical protein